MLRQDIQDFLFEFLPLAEGALICSFDVTMCLQKILCCIYHPLLSFWLHHFRKESDGANQIFY